MSTLSPPLKKNDAESFLKELIDSCKENGFSQLRKTGTENFLKAGLPGRKEEAYKYAPLTSVLNNLGTGKPQSAASPGDALTYLFKDFASGNALSVFLLNGTIIKVPENLPKGLSIVPLEETSPYAKNTGRLSTASSDPLCQLNNSIFSSGLVIHIAKGSSIEKPIVVFNLISSDSPALISSRLLIVAEENTRAGIIEFSDTLRQNHKILSNEVQETFVGKNATLFHYRWQTDCEMGNRINHQLSEIGEKGVYDTMNITTGGTFIRNNLSLFLNGENIEAHLNGFFVGSKNRHVDTRTVVDHLMPRCESFQLYKGIAADKSTGVFNGKIFVRRDAQKTNAYQSSKNMLLGDEATVNAKPELEIYADDVKCSHGSSTGKLNEDALFYLRSRGLGIETARTLLLHAFAGEVFEKIRHEEFKELIIEKIRHIVGGLNTSHAG